MQCCNGRQSIPMGRDPDSKWVHWLALSRLNNTGSIFGTLSSSSFPSSLSKASSNIGDSTSLRSRSSATSYFALLSANEDGSNDGRSFANHRYHGHVSSLITRNIDSSCVAWFTERGHQRQLADMPDKMRQEKAHCSEQSFLDINKTLSSSETWPLQMQKNSLPQDRENAAVSNTAVTTASPASSSVGTTSPLPSPSNNLWDSDIDSLGTFDELLSGFCSALPFDSTNTQANGAAGPCATAGLDDGDLTWLEEQLAFPLNTSDELGKSSPASKRSREVYPGDYTNDGQPHRENITNKKQKTLHPWTNRLDTSSPFSSIVLRPSQ